MTEQPITLSEKVDKLIEVMDKDGKISKKNKKFRLPFMARLGNAKLKQGYVMIVQVSENNAITFRKERIIDSTIKLDDTYHAVGEGDIMTYKGKPALIISKRTKRPYNPNTEEPNDTFGQKHIMSRMMNEVIGTGKKLSMAGISIGGIILLGVVVYAFIAG